MANPAPRQVFTVNSVPTFVPGGGAGANGDLAFDEISGNVYSWSPSANSWISIGSIQMQSQVNKNETINRTYF